MGSPSFMQHKLLENPNYLTILYQTKKQIMKYKELVLDKIEKIGNLLSNLQSAVSRGDQVTYDVMIEKINEYLGDMLTFVNRED